MLATSDGRGRELSTSVDQCIGKTVIVIALEKGLCSGKNTNRDTVLGKEEAQWMCETIGALSSEPLILEFVDHLALSASIRG